MLLSRRRRCPGPSRPWLFIVTTACTIITFFQQVDGYSVGLAPALPPFLPSPNATFNASENAAMSVLVARSETSSVVHDTLFIPAIATMGVFAILCAVCCCQLVLTREAQGSRGGGRLDQPLNVNTQRAVGQDGYNATLTRGLSKSTRKSALSTSPSGPSASPSVRSDAIGFHHHLQQQRQQQQQQQQQQDPYRQYMMAHDQGYPQQYQQYTPPSVAAAARGEGVQPQPYGNVQAPSSVSNPAAAARARINQTSPPNVAAAQRPPVRQTSNSGVKAGWDQYWGRQGSQQGLEQQADPRTSHISAQSSSTRATSDVLSYMTQPEARRPPLPGNQSQPQNQDYPNNIPSQLRPGSIHSNRGMLAPSVPATYNPAASRVSSSTTLAGSTNQRPG